MTPLGSQMVPKSHKEHTIFLFRAETLQMRIPGCLWEAFRDLFEVFWKLFGGIWRKTVQTFLSGLGEAFSIFGTIARQIAVGLLRDFCEIAAFIVALLLRDYCNSYGFAGIVVGLLCYCNSVAVGLLCCSTAFVLPRPRPRRRAKRGARNLHM